MRPVDIEGLVTVGRPTIAADGGFAVFATSRPDVAANRNVGQLWRVDLPGGALRRLTRGVADRAPQLSPDARAVAFLRADGAGTPQVFVIPAVGGEPQQATDARGGVTGFAWSPDGAQLAFTARMPEEGRYGTVEGLEATAEAPRRITGVRWHANGLGYALDRPAHVFVVAAPALDAEPLYTPAARVGEPLTPRAVAADAVQLTTGAASHAGVVFTADGTEILTRPDEIEADARDLRSRIIAVPVDGGPVREVLGAQAGLAVDELIVTPDGTVAFLADGVGESRVDFVAPMVGLWLLEDGAPRRVTADTLDLGEAHLTAVGDDVLVQVRTRGRNDLLRVARDGTTQPVRTDVEVVGHAASADGATIVAAVATPESLGEIEVIDADGIRTLSDFGGALAGRVVRPRELEVTARDGSPVHGWVATPDGEGPFPVILQIHGGPYASYGIHLFDETQVLVAAGYAVVYCNPRGSAGYGREHGRSIRQQMGTVDFHDVIDFLDGAVAADTRLDGDRVGVMGGSYGGYLTAWVIAHDHRFAGAIVERGFLDPVSFQGTSDIGSFFGDEYVGIDPEQMARQSPMAVVDRVTTPTLVLHSELDFRCPLEQATRYYAALKRQGTPAELLVFPGEDHELTRSGQPRHRVERFDAVLDWWQRHLPAS
ncbi:S9 family peptidase [Microbacterium sp. W1N]|uniref:S9 family peptidase n=1 Tax=Microbacterium festucae TaxID=2977531 RepID=UPI0021BF334C|nr:S9 family peptidase [Microbacterium festucae]MCT9820186.1 S9 family peptidase [Microbacterium festucae]